MVLSLKDIEHVWMKKIPKSRKLHEKALLMTPGGGPHCGIVSKWPVQRQVYPPYVWKSKGPCMWDVDGNTYTDYDNHCALFLGHAHPDVVKAIQEQAALRPFAFDFSEIQVNLTEKISKMMRTAEVIDFVNSGTEASMGAVRIARAYTKRKTILKFEDHYHGWSDTLFSSEIGVGKPTKSTAGIPDECFKYTIVVQEGNLELVEKMIKTHNPAAVIMTFSHGSRRGGMSVSAPKTIEYLKGLREITEENDVLLICDEVVTGFRNAPGGAQEYFGVYADLITLGKMVTGGFAGAGGIAGKREIMEIANPIGKEKWECAATWGTFTGSPLQMAAGYAALQVIDHAGGRLNRYANRLGQKLRDGLNEIFERHAFPAEAVGCASISGICFTKQLPIKTPLEYAAKQNYAMLRKWHMWLMTYAGIFHNPGSASSLGATHSIEDIDTYLESAEDFVKKEKS